jgi:glutaredoxin
MAKVQIYSTRICGYCQRAKLLLDSLGVEYMELDIHENMVAMNTMNEMNFTTVPQIRIDDVWIGGYEELLEMKEAGALDSIIKEG